MTHILSPDQTDKLHSDLQQAASDSQSRWQTPCPDFASGSDMRTSDNGLLLVCYGSLDQAARYGWLNAGRALIDKTYLRMLQHAQLLTPIRVWNGELIAKNLDGFIRQDIKAVWDDLPIMSDAQKVALSCQWVAKTAGQLFGSLHSEVAASRLLFFLCPMLPVFNYSQGAIQVLQQQGYEARDLSKYDDFHQAMNRVYQQLKPELDSLEPPTPVFGQAPEQQLIQDMHQQTDWWQRRVFHEWLRNSLAASEQGLFACSSSGGLQ